ncbi:CDP-alcohol phosphatidyltransferase family protein [Nocardiopsis xinjiangensis]|uniref:CDP-alcohol phosphatidyltransferase family protein n=1 Tax=Nocardiopsis xinjiangensis TaxID=124285 RepID=UPI000346DDF2|nr:CDP-alcohol phosphatidyltransferase family protein [Nocardiopsis xinjiangensis]
MNTFTLADVREQTYKPRDSWWTVWLVDPLASRLVAFTANRTSITPNQLTLAALFLGLVSAVCFFLGDWYWLITGAALFHLSFVLDCMDGKVARLKGNGSVFGSWLDYVFDRIRVLICAIALMGGQFLQTGAPVFLWFLLGIVFTDMFRYLNSPQMAKVRSTMRRHIASVIREVEEATEGDTSGVRRAAGTFGSDESVVDHLGDDDASVSLGGTERVNAPGAAMHHADPGQVTQPTATSKAKELQSTTLQKGFDRRFPWYRTMRDSLRTNRIRPHLFSGIEYQMGVFIIAPLVGVFSLTGMLVTIAASAVFMFAFEVLIIYKLWLSTQEFTRVTRDINTALVSLEERRRENAAMS